MMRTKNRKLLSFYWKQKLDDLKNLKLKLHNEIWVESYTTSLELNLMTELELKCYNVVSMKIDDEIRIESYYVIRMKFNDVIDPTSCILGWSGPEYLKSRL